MPFDPSIGTASANSYSTVADADAYFATKRNASNWTDLVESDKENILIESTHAIDDRTTGWIGSQTSVDQSLDWPRSGLSSISIEDNEIPPDIQRATYELALYLLDDNTLDDDVKLDSVRTGSLRIDFDENNPRGGLPKHVSLILQKYGIPSSSSGSIAMVPVERV